MTFGGVDVQPPSVRSDEPEPTVSVVIPAKNEADNLPRSVGRSCPVISTR